MSNLNNKHEISYIEYKAINKLVDAHIKAYHDSLHAVIAFGELLTDGDTYDIDLLEVIDGWTGDRVAEISNTTQLPLRGKLRLYFLDTGEFEHPEIINNKEMRKWVDRLLDRVKAGFEILYQYPATFADRILKPDIKVSSMTAPASGIINMADPLSPPPLPKRK